MRGMGGSGRLVARRYDVEGEISALINMSAALEVLDTATAEPGKEPR